MLKRYAHLTLNNYKIKVANEKEYCNNSKK